MLPRKLYEMLPFLYMLTGIVCAVLIDSTVVLISSMLLIVAGVVVLMMRRSYRKSSHERIHLYRTAYVPDVGQGVEKRSGTDRRYSQVKEWPVFDNSGDKIFSDRRTAERRISPV
jgi:hypothetical protein